MAASSRIHAFPSKESMSTQPIREQPRKSGVHTAVLSSSTVSKLKSRQVRTYRVFLDAGRFVPTSLIDKSTRRKAAEMVARVWFLADWR